MPDTLRREDEIDQRAGDLFNPHSDLKSIKDAENSGNVQSEVNKNSTSEGDTSNSATSAARSAESTSAGFINNVSGSTQDKKKFNLRATLKKRGPIGLILLLVGMGGIGMSLLSPALLLIHFNKTLTEKFNDQLAVMDYRSKLILKKQLGKSTTAGVCSPVKIKCKYRTIGPIQRKKLERAGFKLEPDENKSFGRTKPSTIEFEGRTITASNLLNEAINDPNLRSALRHGYNPLLAGFSDAVAGKVFAALGLKKTKNITPSSNEEDMKKQVKDTASGEAAAKDAPGRPIANEDGTYSDADGKTISKSQYDGLNTAASSIAEEIDGRESLGSLAKKTALKSSIKGAFTSTALGAGAVDTACSAWNVIRVAAAAAKVYQSRQLIRYAFAFRNTADSMIAGDATPEEVSYMSKTLTSINDEGKSATDSDGYRYAAYGDSFNPGNFIQAGSKNNLTDEEVAANEIKNETSKYVNGQIVQGNAMASLVGFISGDKSNAVDKADDACGFVKSWKGQAIVWTATVGGLAAAFFTGGVSVGAGQIAQTAAMGAASVALGILAPKLIDLAKGDVITGDENGNEAGNAIVSGSGALNAQMSQARALGPLKKDDAVRYANATNTVLADYAEEDRLTRSPFDASSKNTFLGSIVNSLAPTASKLSGSGGVTSIANLLPNSLKKFSTTASAKTSASEFESCQDHEYKSRDLAADPFCNLRYGIKTSSFTKDPEEVVDFMVSKGQITSEEDPTPQDKYQEFITKCIERKTSIGDKSDGSDPGDECIVGNAGADEEMYEMFRLFYIDTSIIEGMEYEGPTQSGGSTGVKAMTYNIRSSRLTGNVKERSSMVAQTISSSGANIVGLQEAEDDQVKEITGGVSGFTKHSVATRTILWKTSDFKEEDSGEFGVPKQSLSRPNKMAWVKLKSTSGGMIYVIDIHPDVDSRANRVATAETVIKLIKDKMTDAPVLVLGDMNSDDNGGNDSEVYNVFKDAGLAYTLDNTNNRVNSEYRTTHDIGKDPSKDDKAPHIDQIHFQGEGIVTNEWKTIVDEKTRDASDHNPVIVDLTIPGIAAGNQNVVAGDLTWPVDKKFWTTSKNTFLKPHNGAGTFTSPGTSGIAADLGLPKGTPVYSIAGGKVTKKPLGRSGRQCAGDPNGNDNGGLMIESEIQGGKLSVAYAHGYDVTSKSTVSAGEQIMLLGKVGNACGPHLHIDMSFNNKNICPQYVFRALGTGLTPDLKDLAAKSNGSCSAL
jgi:endonuclease/exonuclease/phosphatase family metal-dependent hydrolase